MKRYYVVYKGQVQGVGFRYTVKMIAEKYNIKGYIRNLSNGNVEMEAQGNNVDFFIKETLNDDRYIRIDDYSLKAIPTKDNEDGFIIRLN